MDKKTKKWGLGLLMLFGMFCCCKMMGCCDGKYSCQGKCSCQRKRRGKERKSIIKMKNCNGCWVISFK